MKNFWTATLWVAGTVAILGALGIARLEFTLLFIQIDALMLAVGAVCILNAYFRR